MKHQRSKMLVVIPFNLPWNWSTDYTNQTAFVLGKRNFVICFMWSDYLSLKEYLIQRRVPVLIKKYSDNVYLFYPMMLLPFKRFAKIVELNEKINMFLLSMFIKFKELGTHFRQKVLWVFDPRTEPMVGYFKKPWKIIYDCVDFFPGTATSQKERNMFIEYEKKLTNEADLVAANSMVLLRHLKKIRKDVVLVPQGFRIDSFEDYKPSEATPKLKKGNKPLIGFVGAVNYRIDYELLYSLAKRRPEWDFAIWGPELQTDLFTNKQKIYYKKLQRLPNIILGKSDKKEIPGIVQQFDVGMIPYIPDDDFNKYCYPMKLFEFFYAGIPVVSIEIEELKRFPDLVKIASTSEDWEKAIDNFISVAWSEGKRRMQRRLARQNSWVSKVEKITENI